MEKLRQKKQSGFTLIETFVAISVLALAIIGPLQMFSQSIADSTYSKYQVTAFYLAAEGLDGVVNKADNNIRMSDPGSPTAWDKDILGLNGTEIRDVDITKPYNDQNYFITGCQAPGCYIVANNDTGLYTSQTGIAGSGQKNTPYRRKIEVTASGAESYKVVSTVTWTYKDKTNTTSFTTYISNI